MPKTSPFFLSRARIHSLVLTTGLASLSWEVIWQIKASLALGVSARGTALTLATMMGGMSIGAFLMGHALKNKRLKHPIRIYGTLEIIIGIAGLLLGTAFQAVEQLDTWAYSAWPESAAWVHIAGIVFAMGVPTICMGATFPVFGLMAKQFRTSVATLYGLNTLGAAGGTLLAAFLLIPQFGITHTVWIIATVNFAVGLCAWLLKPNEAGESQTRHSRRPSPFSPVAEQLMVIVTGYATFTLEVAWFRSLTAAFKSTTSAFAIMLTSVLLALGIAARLIPILKQRKVPLGTLLSWAGILILIATPIVERFDSMPLLPSTTWPIMMILDRFIVTFYVIGPPVLFLGMAVPWILDDQKTTRRWGSLYALNTCAAIVGSISAAWLLLPSIGFARTAWLAGILVLITGLITAPKQKRIAWAGIGIVAILIAVFFESGVGKVRAQGDILNIKEKHANLLESYEGPNATLSVVSYQDGMVRLIIDGSSATGQSGPKEKKKPEHYMPWMGRLPMLELAQPKNALVICFGTGQTANAVRQEGPESLDIVDINPQVYKLAHNFSSNQNVLYDPRVNAIVMDGRAYMRRTQKTYDVITLEPMPPVLAGVNALYSKEFYELARARLSDDGMIAQWLPFHAVPPFYAASIARTFQEVFPNAILCLDPPSQNGILIGSKDDSVKLNGPWPGFKRTDPTRNMTEKEVEYAVILNRKQLHSYGERGAVITDDNQLLAYGDAVYSTFSAKLSSQLREQSLDLIKQVKHPGSSPGAEKKP